VHRFRRAAAIAAGVSVAALALDLLITGDADISIVVVLVALFVVAIRYGSLWTAGYSWSAVVGRNAPVAENATEPPEDERRSLQVRAARAERGVILRTYQALSRAEQARYPRLGPTVDRLLARIRQLARELGVLEGRIQAHHGSSRILHELASVQQAKSAELRDCEADLLAIREEVERVGAGIDGAEDELRGAVQRAAARVAGAD